MLKRLALISVSCLVAISTSGCLHTSATEEVKVSTECAWTQTLTLSREDVLTDETKREIIAHNELRAQNCR